MIYDEFGAQMKREYELFLFALSGRYLSLIAPGADVSPMMIRQFTQSASQLQATFIQTAIQRIEQFATTYPSASAEKRSTRLVSELMRITASNIETLTLRMKGGAQNALAGVKNAHGAMGLLLQQKLSNPEFRVKTPKGRSFDAVSYTHAEARNFAYLAWIDATLERIALTSDLAEVRYPSADHAAYGTVFSISGSTPGYKSFQEMELLFHYNSTAFPHDHVPT